MADKRPIIAVLFACAAIALAAVFLSEGVWRVWRLFGEGLALVAGMLAVIMGIAGVLLLAGKTQGSASR